MISISRSTRAFGLSAAIAALFLSVGHSNPAIADDAHDAHYRLFVGDHADGVVRAFAIDGSPAGAFEIDQTPALTRSESGRTVFAVQGDAGKVAVISTGISFEDHGDHADIKVEDASLLETVIEGAKPAHVIEGSGRIALFDDGSGDVSLFAESALLDGTPEPRILKPGAAHHGLAAPMGDHLVVSVPHENPDEPRVGLKVVDADGEQVGDVVSCLGVHGQAQSARLFAFGCRDGIVIATPGAGGGAPTLEHIATADLGEGNVSTLKGGTAMTYFLGNYGPSSVVVIEPGEETGFTKIDLPTRRVDFALDPALPRNAYVLTENGQLHLIDIVSGAIMQSAKVTEAYSMDGHWRDPRPRLAVAGEAIAITDTRAGVIRLISTKTLEETGTIDVDGTPYTIVAVGGSGAVHDHD